MTAGTMTPYRPGQVTGRDGFAQLLRSEWTKFRTVRGWVIGMAVAVLVTLGLGLFAAGATSSSCQHDGGPVRTGSACGGTDRKSTRLNSSHTVISYAVFCLEKKKKKH